MKTLRFILIILLLLGATTAQAWDIRVNDASLTKDGDSLRIEMWFDLSAIRVTPNKGYWVVPALSISGCTQHLPPIVVSGKRRHRFDYREQTFVTSSAYPSEYCVLRGNGPKRGNEIHYTVSVPYLSWMSDARLTLTQLEKDCCDSRVLTQDTLRAQVFLPREEPPKEVVREVVREVIPVVEPMIVRQTKDSIHHATLTLYIDYPVNEVKILPTFNYNNLELAKLERLLWPLLNKGAVAIRTLSVRGYASPEGRYDENDRVASARTRGFVDYVLKTYPVSPSIIQATHVAEDWDGLVRLLEEKHPPYYIEALDVIRRQGIFDGRERELMNLRGGTVYTTMCASMFPLLRRIEITVGYELCVKESLE